ncbi:MAG TPA: PqqD family protein [Candidatus Saccharimonadales bacterium]|nr:PqqD family protein [Candidatus Saccharimonadales bacterium]
MRRATARIRSTHSAGGAIVIDIDNGKMFSLNTSASVVFQLLVRGLGDKQIVGELMTRFEIPAAVAQRDLDDFRKALDNHALFPARSAGSVE